MAVSSPENPSSEHALPHSALRSREGIRTTGTPHTRRSVTPSPHPLKPEPPSATACPVSGIWVSSLGNMIAHSGEVAVLGSWIPGGFFAGS